jgi:hypothetical protein
MAVVLAQAVIVVLMAAIRRLPITLTRFSMAMALDSVLVSTSICVEAGMGFGMAIETAIGMTSGSGSEVAIGGK